MVDSDLILMVIFGMPLILIAIVVGNIIDSQKSNTQNTDTDHTVKEWRDPRPTSCRWNLHDWFRDEQYKRHCLKCGEQQTFIAGIGVADWSVDFRPMLDKTN